MQTITQALFSNSESTQILKSSGKKPAQFIGETGEPKTEKSTPQENRVSKDELEKVYMVDPVVFNSINKIVQTIMSAPHAIKYKDKKTKAYYEMLIASLGVSGSDITWEELLTQIYLNQCIFGKSFVENIFDKSGKRVVDWDILDVKKMDYAKDGSGNIILDEHQRPVGYTQTLPGNLTIPKNILDRSIASKPDKVNLPGNSIYIESKRIAQMKLYAIGDGFYPLGLIEPIYHSSLRKLNMEHALANAVFRHGFPIVHASLGDLNHEPTPQQINSMILKLKDINFKQEVATPYYYKLDILESKNVEKMQNHLEYFKQNEIAGLGIPEAYATGLGLDTNKAVLTAQTALYELTLKDIIQRTCAAIRRYMFAPVSRSAGLPEIPTIEWDVAGISDIDSKSLRFMTYLEKGMFTIDELKPILANMEKIEIKPTVMTGEPNVNNQ